MSRTPNRHNNDVAAAALVERTEFQHPIFWKRSKRGNLWRRWRELIVTVFKRDGDRFGWSIADGEGPRFSSRAFDTEADAMSSLAEEIVGT